MNIVKVVGIVLLILKIIGLPAVATMTYGIIWGLILVPLAISIVLAFLLED